MHVHPLWMTSCGEVMRVSQVPTDSVDSTDILEVDNSADLLDYDKSEVEGDASSSILSQEMDKEETGQKTSVNVHNNPQWFSELKAKYYVGLNIYAKLLVNLSELINKNYKFD